MWSRAIVLCAIVACGKGSGQPDAAPVYDAALPTLPIVSAGYDHVCAALPSGVVKCWGSNSVGQLGDGTTTDHANPAPVNLRLPVITVASGFRHSCAVLQDRSVRCWGFNDAHQVDPSIVGFETLPTQTGPLAAGAASIVVSTGFSCAILTTGPTQCWGTVLQPNTQYFAVPQIVTELGTSVQNVTNAAKNNTQIIARDSSGTLTCWNGVGALAADCTSPQGSSLGLPADVTDMAFFSNYPNGADTCVVTSGSSLACTTPPFTDPDGGAVMPTDPVSKLGIFGQNTLTGACVLLVSGGVECFDGASWSAVGGVSNAVAVTVGGTVACATFASGGVACWPLPASSAVATAVAGIP